MTRLAAPIGSSDTTIQVASGTGIPVWGILVVGSAHGELMQVCARSGNTLTIGHSSCPNLDGRGFAGTTRAAASTGSVVGMYVNAYYQLATKAEIKAIESTLGPNLSNLAGLFPGTVTQINSQCGITGGPITSSGTLKISEFPVFVSAPSYAYTANCGQLVVRSNLADMFDTIPAAGSSGWPQGNWMDIQNNGPGTETITPSGSTINGQTTLVLHSGAGAHVVSDGTNFVALVTGSGTTGGGGGTDLPTGAQTQYLQIQPNTSAVTYRFNSPAELDVRDYNFAPLGPGGNLLAGSNTITLTPGPLGVIGGAPNMQLYISGGTGAGSAEVVPVTGGSCAGDGMSTCTVIVTVAACGGGTCHTGAWTIGPVASGILEAINSLPGTGGVVKLPSATLPIYGPIVISDDNVTLVGQPSGALFSGLCHPEAGGFYCLSSSTLQAAGAWTAGTYMVTWDGYNSTHGRHFLLGGGARDINFDAHGLASGEIKLRYYDGGEYKDLHLSDHTNASGKTYGLYIESTDVTAAGTETTCGNNGGSALFHDIYVDSYRPGAGGIQIGTPGSTFDVCSNRFSNLGIDTYGSPGLYGLWVANTDNNMFTDVFVAGFGGNKTVQSISTDASASPVATIHATGHGIAPGTTSAAVYLLGVVGSSGSCPGSGEFGPLEGPHIVDYVDADTLTITSPVVGLDPSAVYCVTGTLRGVGMVFGADHTQGNHVTNYTGSVAAVKSGDAGTNPIVNWNWSSDSNGGNLNYARTATLGNQSSIIGGRDGYFSGPLIAARQTRTPFSNLIDTSRVVPNPGQTNAYTSWIMANNTEVRSLAADGTSPIIMLKNDLTNQVYLGSVFGSGGNVRIQTPTGNNIQFQVGNGSASSMFDADGDFSAVGSVQSGAKNFTDLTTTCNGAHEGAMQSIKDSPTNAWGATVSGGSGPFHVNLFCDGTTWHVAATNANGGSGSMTYPTTPGLTVMGVGAWGTSLSATAPVFTGVVKGGSTAAAGGQGFITPNDIYYMGTTSTGTPYPLMTIGLSNQTVYGTNNYYSWYDNTPAEVMRLNSGTGGLYLLTGGLSAFSGVQTNRAGAIFASALPTCNTANEGYQFSVKDSTVIAGGATVVGGGANHIQAYCNGTIWTVMGSAIQSGAVTPQSGNYAVLAADFANNKTITYGTGTFTVTLVSSAAQPANGQFINVINYGTGVITIARNGQNINGGTTSLTLPAGSSTSPSASSIWSDGSNYFASVMNIGGGGGGGGASATYQLTDLSVVRTSATLLTMGSGCGSTTPCNVAFNGTVYSIIAPATFTIGGGSDPAFIYLTSDGIIHAGTVTVGNITCSGCTSVGSISAFPADALPIWTWTSTTGTWDTSGGADKRSVYNQNVQTAGTGITITPSGAAKVFAVDTAVIPSYISIVTNKTFGSTANGACNQQAAITFTGAAAGDPIIVGPPVAFTVGWMPFAWVTSANTVTLQMCNFTGSSGSLAAANYELTIVNP